MSEAEAIKQLVAIGASRHTFDRPDGGEVLVVPQGCDVHAMPPVEPPLPRIRQNPVFHDEASFIAYVQRFKTVETQLFAEPGFIATKPHVTAVFDYHHASGDPDRLAHIAVFHPRYSDQWKLWTGATLGMEQAEFAEFIEENRTDIVDPPAAQLLDMARNFRASKKTNYDAVVYQANGDIKIGYDETTDAKGEVAVPAELELGIPVYFRGNPYSVSVFMRYRVGTGNVTFFLKVDRADIIENDAFNDIVSRIGTAVAIDPYVGRHAA
ncbi:MAG: DUF2303 family protein [Alphaproteobacteria bacterium GM202ARS2]|nr:DUF2303 family protein [Alphaproteobacteria bacterium GM202ARS2]